MGGKQSCPLKLDVNCKWELYPLYNSEECKVPLTNGDKFNMQLYPETMEIVRFARLVYKHDKVMEMLENKDGIVNGKEGWRLLATGRNTAENYFGAAFIRKGNEFRHTHVIISHRGTERKSIANWKSNTEGILNNHPTFAMSSAATFAQNVVNKLPKGSVQIILTGHSLGGWLAQVSCFTLKYLHLVEEGFDPLENGLHHHCVTFDSPGAVQTFKYLNSLRREKQHIKLDITNYVIFPNLVNVINGHFGDLVKIPTESDTKLEDFPATKKLNSLFKILDDTKEMHSIKLFVQLLQAQNEGGSVAERFGTRIPGQPMKPTPLLRITKDWPEVRYRIGCEESKPDSIAKTVWNLYKYGEFEAYLPNPTIKGLQGIATVEYSSFYIQLGRISETEQNLVDCLARISVLLEEKNKSLLKRLLGILFPIALPLFGLMVEERKERIIPFEKKENGDIDFKNDFESFKCFKNIFVWNDSIPTTETLFNDSLWNWVKESLIHYDTLKGSYFLPAFPIFGRNNIIIGSKEELMLTILGILREGDENIILRCLKEDISDILKGVKILEKCCSVSKIILDFSEYENKFEEIEFLGEGRERTKVYFLVHKDAIRLDNSDATDNRQFSLDNDDVVTDLMEKEIVCDGLKGTKYLSDLVDWEFLQPFLMNHLEITLKLLKKHEKIELDRFTRTIFDSEFTYFQVGETYSLHTPEDNSTMGLVQYYQKDCEISNKVNEEITEMDGELVNKEGKSLNEEIVEHSIADAKDFSLGDKTFQKTIVVFVPNTDFDLKVLDKQKNNIFEGNPNVEIHLVQNIPTFFQKFTQICKCNSEKFVDLIRCRVSSSSKEEWRFEHLYQYNPNFYFERKIIPPPVNLKTFCKEMLAVYNTDQEKKKSKIEISGMKVEFKESLSPAKALLIVESDSDALDLDNLCFVKYSRDIQLNRNIFKIFPEVENASGSSSEEHLCVNTTTNFNSETRELWHKSLVGNIFFHHISRDNLSLSIPTRRHNVEFNSKPCVNVEEAFCDNSFFILSDEPGMGKSTAMAKILQSLFRNEKDFIVLIELKSIGHFDVIHNDPGLEHNFISFKKFHFFKLFVQFISRNLNLNILNEFLFTEAMIQKSHHLTVVFDGYDEMVDEQKKKFKEMLKHLRKLDNFRVIITTRPNEQTSLEAALCTFSHVFDPIEKTRDKVDFLVNIWTGIIRCRSEHLRHLAEEIIAKAHNHIIEDRVSFLGVPLQLRILSEISLDLARSVANFKTLYGTKVNYSTDSNRIDTDSNNPGFLQGFSLNRKFLEGEDVQKIELEKFIEEHSNLGKIYDHFLNRKIEIYVQEKLGSFSQNQKEIVDSIKRANEPTLYWLAGETLQLGDYYSFLANIPHTSFPSCLEPLLKTGIVYGLNDEKKLPQFLHKTFAEFYAAKCLFGVVGKAYINEDPHVQVEGEYLLNFILTKFIDEMWSNMVSREFFINMIKNDENIYNALHNSSFLPYSYPKIVEKVKNCPKFLYVQDLCIVNFMMIGWSQWDIIDLVREMRLHLVFVIDIRFLKLLVGLSAILRKFSQYYEGGYKEAPFLCSERQGKYPIYYSLNDATNFFHEGYEGKFQFFETRNTKENSLQDFIKQWPILSTLIIDKDHIFKIKDKLDFLLWSSPKDFDLGFGKSDWSFYPLAYIKELGEIHKMITFETGILNVGVTQLSEDGNPSKTHSDCKPKQFNSIQLPEAKTLGDTIREVWYTKPEYLSPDQEQLIEPPLVEISPNYSAIVAIGSR